MVFILRGAWGVCPTKGPHRVKCQGILHHPYKHRNIAVSKHESNNPDTPSLLQEESPLPCRATEEERPHIYSAYLIVLQSYHTDYLVVGNGHHSVISLQSNGSTNRKRSSRRPEYGIYTLAYYWRLVEGVASYKVYITSLYLPI